jgi:CHAT domain-containing protein
MPGIEINIGVFSDLIVDFPLGKLAINIDISLTGYQLIATASERLLPHDRGTLWHNFGKAYMKRINGKKAENLEEAIKYFKAALKIWTRDKFPQGWAKTISNIGEAYRNRINEKKAENLEKAIRYHQVALKVYNNCQDFTEQWADIKMNLGNAYLDRICGERAENIETAINCYEEALKVITREKWSEKWAMIQLNLGSAYFYRLRKNSVENLRAAICYYNAALEIYTREDFPQYWATIKSNLGPAYSKLSDKEQKLENLEKAIICHLSAFDVFTHKDFPKEWADNQNNLGKSYRQCIFISRANYLKKAICCYLEALEVRNFRDFPYDWAMTKHNLGGAYCQAKSFEVGIICFLDALKVRTKGNFPQDYILTQLNLGNAYQEAKKFPEAYTSFVSAIYTVESLRFEIVSGSGMEADKQKLAEEWNRLYQRMVEVCLELAKEDPQYYNQAIEYIERSKARNLVELLANKDIYPKSDFYLNSEIYQTHCHQLEQLRRQIPAKQRELEILSRESEEQNRDEIERLRQELNQLQQQRDELLAEINQIDSSFTFTQKVQPIPFSDIQSLTDENTAIVEWYITGSQILTFIIARHHPHPIVISSSSEDMTVLENWDQEYRDSYQKQNTQWINNLANRLQNLAKILHIDDILSSIDDCFSQSNAQCNRLILIPHRYLHLFPLHALPLGDGKLLFERFSQGVGYAPSCQLLKQAKDQEQHRPDFTRLFAIQNPTRQPARPLLGSQLEIDKIRQHFAPQHSIILKEAEATEPNLYKCMEQMRFSNCIHFSCHGKFYPESPLKSALLLADPEGKLGEEANLTLDEVFEKLYLNQCRLVTFSACESGMTDPNSISDEYIGLPSGFLYAGSLSVVSTLWSVDPIATTLLMVKFYHNLKRLPQIKTGDVAIALNKAQKWLRTLTHEKWARIQSYPQFKLLVEEAFKNSPKRDRNKFKDSLSESLSLNRQPLPFANPYYWSAFVAIGI